MLRIQAYTSTAQSPAAHVLGCSVILIGGVGYSTSSIECAAQFKQEFWDFLKEGPLAQSSYHSLPGLALAVVAATASSCTIQTLEELGFSILYGPFQNQYHEPFGYFNLWGKNLWDPALKAEVMYLNRQRYAWAQALGGTLPALAGPGF